MVDVQPQAVGVVKVVVPPGPEPAAQIHGNAQRGAEVVGDGVDEGAFLFRGIPGLVLHSEDVRSAAEVVQGLHQFAGAGRGSPGLGGHGGDGVQDLHDAVSLSGAQGAAGRFSSRPSV